MLKKMLKLAAAGLALSVACAQAASAEYPERAVTVIVPFSAGGNTDTIARIVADQLSKDLGQAVVIENRGGGGGTVGASLAAGADPDGYTLLFGTAGSHSVNPILREVTYDPIADFDPVSVAVISSVLIVVHPSVEAKTMEEFVALTSGGAELNYASGGIGTLAHVAGAIYNEKTGSSLVHVPYQGSGQARNDLLAGRVQVMMNNIPSFISQVKSGALRPLALGAAKRSTLLPDVPTTAEVGLEGMEMGSWYGLLAPKGTPPEAIQRLFAAMKTLETSKEVKERLAGIGSELTTSDSPEQFRAYMNEQLGWWREVLDDPAFRK